MSSDKDKWIRVANVGDKDVWEEKVNLLSELRVAKREIFLKYYF